MMPNPNAIVALVLRIDPPLDSPGGSESGFTIELEGGQRVRLEPGEKTGVALVRVLDGLRTLRRPVYLEIDPATTAITRVLIPLVTRVAALRALDNGVLSVELELSHARHLLRRSNADAGELEAALRDAMGTRSPVAVTETDAHEIIDVRRLPPGFSGEVPHFPRPEYPARVPWSIDWFKWHWWHFWRCRWWPWYWFRCLSMTRAQQVFDAMSATSCAPLTVPPPCIPFLYPDDGCWGRASEMCRLMIDMGLSPRKVWIQGWLHVSTKNNPNCEVYWGWHVAPTLCVRGPKWWRAQRMVIDPSLFTTPVSQATWKGVQGDPNATLTPSPASTFYLWGNVQDPGYVQTNQVLATYRLALQNRAIQVGPPPYANCP